MEENTQAVVNQETTQSEKEQVKTLPTDVEKEEVKKEQSRKTNAYYAEQRRKREEQIKHEAYIKGKIEASNVNTFTNKPIADETDLKYFEMQKAIEKSGGDPNDVGSLISYIANQDREKLKEAKNEKLKKEQINKNFEEFEKETKLKVSDVLNNQDFVDFAGSRLGSESLLNVYNSYQKYNSRIEEMVNKKVEEELNKRKVAQTTNASRQESSTSDYKKPESFEEAMESIRNWKI